MLYLMKINSQMNKSYLKMKNSTWVTYLTLSCAISTVALVMQNPLYSLGAVLFGICSILTNLKKIKNKLFI